uniref:Protein 6 n=1 Tax=Chamaemelum virus 1 TaxID=2977963 RepID=A0A9N7AB27_9RHAB|nr:TPA_asm: protein 6 [Chamaemelum virus 1]
MEWIESYDEASDESQTLTIVNANVRDTIKVFLRLPPPMLEKNVRITICTYKGDQTCEVGISSRAGDLLYKTYVLIQKSNQGACAYGSIRAANHGRLIAQLAGRQLAGHSMFTPGTHIELKTYKVGNYRYFEVFSRVAGFVSEPFRPSIYTFGIGVSGHEGVRLSGVQIIIE